MGGIQLADSRRLSPSTGQNIGEVSVLRVPAIVASPDITRLSILERSMSG